ncbi:testis-specific Y-encoded protein 3-like [Suncus etruscus]|uniref:testis-specific Y-encoded protein 3-like n=1 Tax=Suncus etruscus TaxID=109475 RepID=UPI00210F2609|nr:testis-specific Y-encoded protein 3-like [Suncus etruscus]
MADHEDAMTETQPLENKPDEQLQEETASRTLPEQPPLEELQALQLEMEPVNKQASRAFYRFKLRMKQKRQYHLELRSNIIQGIPGFWAKTFVNHPQMSALISHQDKELLSYITNLKVEDPTHPNDGYKIMLFFRKNRYFWNDVVAKEYITGITGLKPSHSTPIHWCHGFELKASERRHHNCSPNFFNWFYDHNFEGSTRIADIIIKELWPNPLKYYMKKRIPEQGTVKQAVEN